MRGDELRVQVNLRTHYNVMWKRSYKWILYYYVIHSGHENILTMYRLYARVLNNNNNNNLRCRTVFYTRIMIFRFSRFSKKPKLYPVVHREVTRSVHRYSMSAVRSWKLPRTSQLAFSIQLYLQADEKSI